MIIIGNIVTDRWGTQFLQNKDDIVSRQSPQRYSQTALGEIPICHVISRNFSIKYQFGIRAKRDV
jgi:hypothetical protein